MGVSERSALDESGLGFSPSMLSGTMLTSSRLSEPDAGSPGRGSSLSSVEPSLLGTPQQRKPQQHEPRLSFAGFPGLDHIVAIDTVEEVRDGRRQSMVVRLRKRIAGTPGSARKGSSNFRRLPLAQLTNRREEEGTPTGSSRAREELHEEAGKCELRTPRLDSEELRCEVEIEDKELVGFCGVVLQLLRRELEAGDGDGEAYSQETLPQLREAFNNLVSCTQVPQFLSQKAKQLKLDLEQQLRKQGVEPAALETLCEEGEEEEDGADGDDWKPRSALGPSDEREGMVHFIKKTVRAIAVLKEKIVADKEAMARFEEEKQRVAELAKEDARREADEEWARRLSIVRRDTERQTKEKLEQEFHRAQREQLQRTESRVREEVASDWSMRLREEQRNRRMSAQLKLTAAVERTAKRAEKDKEQALSALAEELEKEKEDVARNAAQLARKSAEQEFNRKLNVVMQETKEELMEQLKAHQEEHFRRQVQSHEVMQGRSSDRFVRHSSGHSAGSSIHVQRGEQRFSQEVRRYSFVEGTATGHHERREHMQQHQQAVMSSSASRVVRGLSQDFALRGGTQNVNVQEIETTERRVSFVMKSRNSGDFSAEFALPSPIPLAPARLEESSASPQQLCTPQPLGAKAKADPERPEAPRVSLGSRPEAATPRAPEAAEPVSAAAAASPGGVSDAGQPTSSSGIPEGLDFCILDLSVTPGELHGSLSTRYREYNVCALVRIARPGGAAGETTDLRTRKTMRYSAARGMFFDRLLREAEKLGLQFSFQPLFDSFPPKSMGNSNAMATAKLRAKAIQTYLLSVYDVATRLIRISKDEQDRADIRQMLQVLFGDFM